MAYMESIPVVCRNCGNKQSFLSINGERPPMDRSFAVCNKCGFKSIWLYEKIEIDEDGNIAIPAFLRDPFNLAEERNLANRIKDKK